MMEKSFFCRSTVLFVLACLLPLFLSHAEARAEDDGPAGKFVPPEGKVLIIIGQDKYAGDEYVKAFGVTPAGLMFYTSLKHLEGIYNPIDLGGGLHHAQYMVEKYPATVLQIGLYMVDSLDDISKGVLDFNIQELGKFIQSTKRPVYLRIGYEFDFGGNRYDPEKYKKAFRYIVDKLRKQGVDNASYVWHSCTLDDSKPFMEWYPGDEYVDWFAVSYFYREQKQYLDAMAKLAHEHKKPLMVGEATPFGTGTYFGEKSWAEWFQPFFEFVRKEKVQAVSYISWDWDKIPMFQGQGWGDCRLHADEKFKKLWRKEMEKPEYLMSSPELFRQLGYKP
jgi:hypothetical protein